MRANLANYMHILLKLETQCSRQTELARQLHFAASIPRRIERILSDNIEGEKEENITELLKVIIAKLEAVRNP